jgi:hypothetical protein
VVAEGVPGLKRTEVFAGVQTPALGGDLTAVKVNGQWLTLGLTVDDVSGLVWTVDDLGGEDGQMLREWLEPIAEAVGAKILVTDDADALKSVVDELGLEQQVCKSHVKRNTQALIDSLLPEATMDADGSLAVCGVSAEQALADLRRLGELFGTHRPEDVDAWAAMHLRYVNGCAPQAGQKATVAYRLRLLFLDRWNLWSRLTRYRSWRGPHGETIDGTNNHAERAIGWWVKERYRTMRGYKRVQSAVHVSHLLAWCGSHLNRGGVDLSSLVA